MLCNRGSFVVFNILLSLFFYLLFISSCMYLDKLEIFIQIKHLFVLIHRNKGEIGTVKVFKPFSNFLTGASFCESFWLIFMLVARRRARSLGFTIIWAFTQENLTLMHTNNKGADQLAHPRSLVSAFVIPYLKGMAIKYLLLALDSLLN